MSKHPTSELSPRDIACMEYGSAYYALVDSFQQRHTFPFPCKGMAWALLSQARAARDRIFRDCYDCVHEDAFDCTVRGERLIDCCGWIDYAPTCPHYEERREK